MKAIPDILKIVSRDLRKNMTESEKLLWEKLKSRNFHWKKFVRQSPIYIFTENSWLDRYLIPDFICFEDKLIIEIDWSIHDIEEIYQLDRTKEELLFKLWFKVIRFKNEEIFENIDLVLEKIKSFF